MDNQKNEPKIIKIKKKKSFFKKIKKILILTIIILAIGTYYFIKNKPDLSETTYTLTAASKSSVFSYVSASGQIASLNQADIKTQVNGKLKEIKVEIGDKIEKGQVLAILENKDLERKLLETQNSLAIAKNNLNIKLAGPSEEDILNAKISLENSKNAYENSLTSLNTVKKTAEDNLRKSEQDLASAQRSYDYTLNQTDLNVFTENQDVTNTYNNAKNNLDAAYLNLRSVLISADNILGLNFYNNNDTSHYDYLLGVKDSSSKTLSLSSFYKTKNLLESFEKEYLLLKKDQDFDSLEKLLDSLLAVSENSKEMMSLIYNTLVNTVTSANFSESQLNSLKQSASSGESSSLSNTNSLRSSLQNIEKLKNGSDLNNLSNLNSLENSRINLENAKLNLEKTKTDNEKNIISAENEINSRKMSYDLAKIQYEDKIAHPKEVDILPYRIQLSQAEANYKEAKENLENLNIISSINGQVAKINFTVGEDLSSSNSLFSLISDESLVEAVLNEIDIAKIKLGQKAMVSISALGDLNFSGEIIEIDSLGTTNQGVVSYGIKILLDVTNSEIKPQMSASAEIIVNESISVLTLANSAVKKDNSGNYYVEYFSDNLENKLEIKNKTPEIKYVEIGLIGDSLTEIISGLEESDLVVLRSQTNTTSTATNTTTQTTNLFNLGGGAMPTGSMGRGGGGGPQFMMR